MADGYLSVVSFFFATVFDVALLRVFRSHLRQILALQRYQPVYSSSGRRNGVRY
jgi:hypothetical protein